MDLKDQINQKQLGFNLSHHSQRCSLLVSFKRLSNESLGLGNRFQKSRQKQQKRKKERKARKEKISLTKIWKKANKPAQIEGAFLLHYRSYSSYCSFYIIVRQRGITFVLKSFAENYQKFLKWKPKLCSSKIFLQNTEPRLTEQPCSLPDSDQFRPSFEAIIFSTLSLLVGEQFWFCKPPEKTSLSTSNSSLKLQLRQYMEHCSKNLFDSFSAFGEHFSRVFPHWFESSNIYR